MKEPFSFYGTEEGLKFFLVDCGSGLTHLIIFPDDTVMLFDCNLVNDEEHSRRGKQSILDLFSKVIPLKNKTGLKQEQCIDIFVNSHRDTDHLKGLKDVNERFPIKSIWDSGQQGANTDDADYQYYMRLRNNLKNQNKANLVVPTPSDGVFKSYGDTDVYVLSSANDFVSEGNHYLSEAADKIQHTNCMVLLLKFAGRKMLLTGDSDWKAWKENIVPNFKNAIVNFKNSDILIASHHGSRTFFTSEEEVDEAKHPDTTYTESIRLIKPKVTLISCAEYEYKGYHLPNKEAMRLYKEYTSNGQVYTTNNEGTFCGRIDREGNFSVTPWQFRNIGGKTDKRIFVKCITDTGEELKNGFAYPVGHRLKFVVLGTGEVLDSRDNPKVYWQVCNAGYGAYSHHHEIYYKGTYEDYGKFKFVRDLSYVGTHLLRCKVINSKKGFYQTVIFVVHGK